jgi:O-antigen ligase
MVNGCGVGYDAPHATYLRYTDEQQNGYAVTVRENTLLAWRAAAFLIGGALPMILMGRAVLAVWLGLGLIFGLVAMGRSAFAAETWSSALRTTGVKISGVLFFGLTVSCAYSIDAAHSYSRLLEVSGIMLAGLLLYVILRDMPARALNYSLKVMGVLTIIMILLCLADAFSNSQRLSMGLHGSRKWAEASRLNYMSSVFAVLLPYLWVWLHRKWRDGEFVARMLAVPISALGFFTVFACGGRAGWVAIVVATVLYLVLGGRWHGLVLHTRHWVMLPLVMVAGPVGYGLSRGWDVMLGRLAFWNEPNGAAMSGRTEIWQFALGHMGDNPISGIGLSAFRKLPLPEVTSEAFSNAHPHNFLIQLALETGIVGTVPALALIAVVLVSLWRYAQVNLYGLGGFCSVAAFLVASLANTSIFQAWWLAFFVVSAIFGVRLCRLERKG